MEFIEKILDLPVIIQGALGSFLFWLSYEAIKRLVGYITFFVSKFNKNIKLEFLLYEQAHSLQEILDVGSDHKVLDSLRLSIFHMTLNRAIKGVIYVCLGLLTTPFLGILSNIAYIFAIFYFFRALKCVHIEVVSKNNKEWHIKRVNELTEEIEKIHKK